MNELSNSLRVARNDEAFHYDIDGVSFDRRVGVIVASDNSRFKNATLLLHNVMGIAIAIHWCSE
jgi:hypothetical protein